eukprot:6203953-Pleurochrysis_carterae.AAC.2
MMRSRLGARPLDSLSCPACLRLGPMRFAPSSWLEAASWSAPRALELEHSCVLPFDGRSRDGFFLGSVSASAGETYAAQASSGGTIHSLCEVHTFRHKNNIAPAQVSLEVAPEVAPAAAPRFEADESPFPAQAPVLAGARAPELLLGFPSYASQLAIFGKIPRFPVSVDFGKARSAVFGRGGSAAVLRRPAVRGYAGSRVARQTCIHLGYVEQDVCIGSYVSINVHVRSIATGARAPGFATHTHGACLTCSAQQHRARAPCPVTL